MKSFCLKLFLLVLIVCSVVALSSCQNINNDHDHSLTYHEAKAPTCTSDGIVDYWYCESCDKKYSDAQATNEITDILVPAVHQLVFKSKVEPSCNEDGCKEHWQCELCSAKFTDQTAVSVAYNTWIPGDHSFVGGICNRCNAIGTPELIYELSGDAYTVIGVSDRNLIRIVIPATYNDIPVIAIGAGAFDNCKNLRSLEIGLNVTELPESFLSGCDKLIEIVNDKSLSISSNVLPDSVKSVDNKCSRIKNESGYLFYIKNDDESHLIDYIGEDNELVLPEDFVIDEQFRFIVPKILLAKDYEDTILIPMLEKFEGLLNEYCGAKYPDTEFSFFENENYEAYYCGCISNKTTGGLRGYIKDMKTIYTAVLQKNSPEFEALSKIYNDLMKINVAYTLKNPNAYENHATILENMHRDYPITKTGAAIYVYSNSDTYEGNRAVANIIKTNINTYTFDIMHEQEKACGFDRIKENYYNGYHVIDKAFYERDNITSVTIIGGVKSIGEEAFSSCKNLKSLVIESGTIGEKAFANCEKLENVTLNTNLNSWQIRATAFLNCPSIKKIIIGKDVSEIDVYSSFGNVSPQSIEVDSDNQAFSSIDGILYSIDGKKLIYYPSAMVKESFTVQSSVELIGEYAFFMCEGIKNITIPGNVSKISKNAFAYASIEKLNVSNGVAEIYAYAFKECNNLKSISISSTVRTVEIGAFSGCDEAIITVDSGNNVFHAHGNCLILTEEKLLIFGNKHSVIPNDGSVTVIAAEAFSYCESLTEITIPEAIKFVMSGVFLKSVNLKTINTGAAPIYEVDTIFTIVDGAPKTVYQQGEELNSEVETLKKLFASEVRQLHLCRDFNNIESYIKTFAAWLEPTKIEHT